MRQKWSTVDAPERHPESYTVWLDETARIASFHEIVGYQRHNYNNHSYFMDFLYSLQERGYRFQ